MNHAMRHRHVSWRRKHQGKTASLNLVSLMDIFTILVFFLMVNASDVEVLDAPADVTLPDSISEQQARVNPVIVVSANGISMAGKQVAELPLATDETIIPLLSEALAKLAATLPELSSDQAGYAITVMGDKQVPYQQLKKVLATCADASFTRISLAVVTNRKGEVEG